MIRSRVVVAGTLMVLAVATGARAQSVDGSSTSNAVIAPHRFSLPDPCHAGQTISVGGKVLVRLATDIGTLIQTTKVRVRLAAERDGSGGTDYDISGEAEANFMTLLSGTPLSNRYVLPITIRVETDTASEFVKTPYASFEYSFRLRVDPATNTTTGFSFVEESAVCQAQ